MGLIADQRDVIQYLNEVIARLREKLARKKSGEEVEHGGYIFKKAATKIRGWVKLFPSPDFQTIATGENPEDQEFFQRMLRQPKKSGKPSAHPQMDKLRAQLWAAEDRCRVLNVRANAAYLRCRAKGGSSESCRSLFIQIDCPQAVAIRDQIKALARSGGG